MSDQPSEERTTQIDRRLPRYLAIRDHLFSRISNGTWTFDEALPSETKLAEQYGVALGTMRRAIEELVNEGVLERRHGSGTYLRRSDFSRSLSRFMRFRSSHSTLSPQTTRVQGVRLGLIPRYAAEPLRLQEGDQAIYIDRRRFHDNKLFVAEDIWLLLDRFKPLLAMPPEEIGPMLYRTYETHCGEVIARAVESLRVLTADAEMAALLGTDVGSPTISIERVAYDLTNQPVEWRRSRGKADHFEYRIEIR